MTTEQNKSGENDGAVDRLTLHRSPLNPPAAARSDPLLQKQFLVSNYELLAPDHPAMQCLADCLKLEGFDVIMRVQEFYA